MYLFIMLKYIDDHEPTLEELQKLVGGYIEVHKLRNGDDLVMNEDGLMQNLPINQEATKLFMANGGVSQICGFCVHVKAGLMK
jgi:hypothetical protein